MNRWRWYLGLAAAVGLTSAVLSSRSSGTGDRAGKRRDDAQLRQPAMRRVARGRAAFNDRNPGKLGGNGRACADCHVPSEAFQLSPAAARARFEALIARSGRKQERGRSALPAGGRRRLSCERRQRERLLESRGKRARSRDDALAGERQAHRSRNGSTVGRNVRRSLARGDARDQRRDHRTGRRFADLAARSAARPPSWARTPTARTGRVAISTMRASARYRNRPAARCSRTRRCSLEPPDAPAG